MFFCMVIIFRIFFISKFITLKFKWSRYEKFCPSFLLHFFLTFFICRWEKWKSFYFILLFCFFFFISSINHGKYFHNKITMPFLCVYVRGRRKSWWGEGIGGWLSCFDNLIKYIHLLLLYSSNSYKSVYRMKMCDFRFKINIRWLWLFFYDTI